MRKKVGTEFGLDAGNVMIIVRAFYGLKSSGTSFIAFLAEPLYDIEYVLSMAYPDMWTRLAMKDDGFQYLEYVLCYVENVLSISHRCLG